jgi:hypothetical protein
MLVTVSEGTVNADSIWMLTTNDPITIDTTALTFERKDAGAVAVPDVPMKTVRASRGGNVANLAGGAPNTADGVSLAVNDRIFVLGQSTASQNGIYVVTVVGTGANGTWVRAADVISSGMLVTVSEGTTNADSLWMLTTDDPITIGTTGLTFARKDIGVISAPGTAPLFACRAWVNFNGTGTVAIRASGNVSSITDNGTGDYTVNFTTAMTDANYSVAASCQAQSVANNLQVEVNGTVSGYLTTSSVRLVLNSGTASQALNDSPYVSAAIFR